MNKFRHVVLAPLVASGALFTLMSPVAHAIDGIINLSGNITDVARDINGQTPGTGNAISVDLSVVAPTHFAAIGTDSAFRELDLVLSDADYTNNKKISAAFDTVTNVDCISGNLMPMGSSRARDVQIQIFGNSAASTTKIPLGLIETAPQKAAVNKNTTTPEYKASYASAEKTVTADADLSHIRHLLTYE